MLWDSWEEKQEGLFLFSWEGPDPRNTVEHVWWGVSHNDFFGKGERSRNKNNTDPTFHQSWGGGWESWYGIIPLLSRSPRSHLSPEKPPWAWHPVAVQDTKDRTRRMVKPARRSSWPRVCHPTVLPWETWGPFLCPLSAHHHPVQDTGPSGKIKPTEEPSWFSWQVLGKSIQLLKTLPELQTQKEKGKDEDTGEGAL